MSGVPITPTEFRTRFPVFVSVTDNELTPIIADVVYFLQNYSTADPALYTILQMYLTAHFLVIQQQADGGDNSSALPASSASLGEASIGYAINAGDMSSLFTMLNSTSYGQKFCLFFEQARVNIQPWAML